MFAFVQSAAPGGLAGGLKTVVLGLPSLTDMHWPMSGLAILMSLAGGMGRVAAPLPGASIVIAP
jgi:branched-chain amino acid transport system permease protein